MQEAALFCGGPSLSASTPHSSCYRPVQDVVATVLHIVVSPVTPRSGSAVQRSSSALRALVAATRLAHRRPALPQPRPGVPASTASCRPAASASAAYRTRISSRAARQAAPCSSHPGGRMSASVRATPTSEFPTRTLPLEVSEGKARHKRGEPQRDLRDFGTHWREVDADRRSASCTSLPAAAPNILHRRRRRPRSAPACSSSSPLADRRQRRLGEELHRHGPPASSTTTTRKCALPQAGSRTAEVEQLLRSGSFGSPGRRLVRTAVQVLLKRRARPR